MGRGGICASRSFSLLLVFRHGPKECENLASHPKKKLSSFGSPFGSPFPPPKSVEQRPSRKLKVPDRLALARNSQAPASFPSSSSYVLYDVGERNRANNRRLCGGDRQSNGTSGSQMDRVSAPMQRDRLHTKTTLLTRTVRRALQKNTCDSANHDVRKSFNERGMPPSFAEVIKAATLRFPGVGGGGAGAVLCLRLF